MKIGVLALQGSFKEHIRMLKSLGVETVEVKLPKDLENIKGLIIPGGESTTIGKLLQKTNLDEKIKEMYSKGALCIYGTCAGTILLAKFIQDNNQPSLGLLDIIIKRNDYGRQIDSFEALLNISNFKKPFKGVFIRAPIIHRVGENVEVLSTFNAMPVLIREGKLLASTFHPELTNDPRIHRYFLNMINLYTAEYRKNPKISKL